ncbi:MAG TPA: DUF4388 domain-containing protein [Thermoanaerobaculia bacterium]|nr:DUF4388 domain-containing protein [Thermoanaerobaculia bacterium]
MPDTEQEKRYEYHGQLRQTALPEMLYTIYLHRVPGTIAARQSEVTKEIFVRDGAVIHATSTDRDDSLGHHLERTGRLTPGQLAASTQLRGESPKRHGELLIDHDYLSPGALYEAIQEQIRAIVWSLFSWEEGEVTFTIGEFDEAHMVRIYLPLRQVILEGVKRAPDAKALVARLGRKETVFEPQWNTEELIEAALDALELALLRLVDGKRTLYELCTQGPHKPAENARLIYAFHVLRLIRRSQNGRSGVVKIRFQRDSGAFGRPS